MKITYDLSILGNGELYPSARAGIYRVVVELADALKKSPNCSLNFSAFEGNLYSLTLKHLLSSPEYKEAYLPNFPHSLTHYHLTGRLDELNCRVAATTGLKQVGWRSTRKVTDLYRKLFSPESRIRRNLQRTDLFHSPFFAIAPQVRKHKHISTFLSIYDLIGILYPEFFSLAPGADHPHKTIVDSIGREDWVVCISQSTKDDLCNYRHDLDPRRIFVTPLGASQWFYPCKSDQAIEEVHARYKIPKVPYVLSVCTLEPRKNLAHLLRCFGELIQQEKLSNLHLVLVGQLGWKYESVFAELAAAKHLRDRVIITGYVENKDLAALYSGSLFFVYPSFYEGFGLPPLEAMQCGVPVITSNTSSLPEVVGSAGIMVDPKDSDALCQAMLKLATDEVAREVMSKQSWEQSRKFSWSLCADLTLEAYQVAIRSK
jgi:glycosyltransferase involved in cell wall biosynthesis